MRGAAVLLCVACVAAAAIGQATSAGLSLRAVAEVEVTSIRDGQTSVRLAPAERVVPGDAVIYTLEIRNAGKVAVRSPVVTYAIPAHMSYVEDSATGPGAEVSYSLDGHQFDRPENLHVPGSDGHERLAMPQEYTHIRWNLKNTLKPKSVAFARFRAIVK